MVGLLVRIHIHPFGAVVHLIATQDASHFEPSDAVVDATLPLAHHYRVINVLIEPNFIGWNLFDYIKAVQIRDLFFASTIPLLTVVALHGGFISGIIVGIDRCAREFLKHHEHGGINTGVVSRQGFTTWPRI